MTWRPGICAAVLIVALVSGPVRADDGADLCLDAPYRAAVTPAQADLVGLLARLRSFADAYPSLLSALDARRPTICEVSGAVGARGHFDLDENVVAIHEDLTEGQRLAVLIHELRHLDQVGRGLCPADTLAMEEVARATFAMEADASAVTAHVAYEMRTAGDPTVWEALAAFERYADIAEAYADARVATGSVARAMGAAFEQWYASDWRRERYYLATCSDYLDRVDEAHRLPSYGLLDDGYFDDLCRLPDGSAYGCAAPAGIGVR